MRTVGATLQVQGHLTWAGKAKQQAEGGGWGALDPLGALSTKLLYSPFFWEYCPALSRLGCASERTWVDGRWAATSNYLQARPHA